MYQKVFQRYEIKYLITLEQKQKLLKEMNNNIILDNYGLTTIRNIYFDTPNYLLIRKSIEKPTYKEKLRIRSYEKATKDTKVFIELKKKYNGVVYKRRLSLSLEETNDWLLEDRRCYKTNQIVNEIDYFISYYKNLRPSLFLSYEREAYYGTNDKTLRLTFDKNIIARTKDISLESEIYGDKLLDDNKILLEIKCNGGIPIWLTTLLSKEKIYKQSFSKYGTAYEKLILPNLNKNNIQEEEING